MIYLFIYLSLSYIAIIELLQQKPSNNILLLLLIVLLCLISGLRYETGVDWLVYENYYKHIDPIDSVLKGNTRYFSLMAFEPGFNIFLSVTKWIGLNINGVFLIISIANSILLFHSLKRYSSMPAFGVLLYFVFIFFMYDMSAIRQAIAINIFFFSLQFIYNRKFINYFICILVATSFHFSAVILFPLYFLINKTFKTRILNIIFLVGILIYLFNVRWLSAILINIAELLPEGILFKKIAYYITSEVFSKSRSFSLGFIMNILLYILFIINKDKIKNIKYSNIFFNLFYINILVFVYLFEFLDISIRIRGFFLISNIIAFSYLILSYTKPNNRIIILCSFLLYSFYVGKIYFLETDEAIAYNPYQNIIINKVFNIESTGKERLKTHYINYTRNANQ